VRIVHLSVGTGPIDISIKEEIKKIAKNGRLKVATIDQKSTPKTRSTQLTPVELDRISNVLTME
jgi:hypothetical protein